MFQTLAASCAGVLADAGGVHVGADVALAGWVIGLGG